MNFKKQSFLIFLSCMVFMMLPLIGGCAEVGELKPVEFTFASGWPPPGVGISADYVMMWQEKVTANTDGKVTFKNYWGGSLGAPNELIDMINDKVVDVALTYAWLTEDMMPLWDFHYAIPFQPTHNPEILMGATYQVMEEFPEFEKEAADKNCKMLFRIPNTPLLLASIDPINSLEDLKGKKIACVGKYMSQWVDSLGASTIAAPKTERYSMLELNVIDASLDCASNLYEYDQISVAPYIFDPKLFQAPSETLFMNLDKFGSLPQEYQDIMMEAANEVSTEVGNKLIKEALTMMINKWKADDPTLNIVEISGADTQYWKEVCPDTGKMWAEMRAAQGYPTIEILNRYKEICASMGYKF